LLTKKTLNLLTTKEPKITAGREFPYFGAGHSTQPMPTGPQSQGLAKMAAKESCGIATSGGVRVMHGGRQILAPQPAGAMPDPSLTTPPPSGGFFMASIKFSHPEFPDN
jgi:hypothetical protein